MFRSRFLLTFAAFFCSAGFSFAQARWWMDEPVRLLQTNLRETDAGLDVERLARQVADFKANALLFGMGGIVASYPTQVPFHYASPHLPPGRDLFGEMLREMHARKIRIIGRFDLSKTQKAVFDAHPEWFFKRANGEPAIYSGLYSTCINGGYYREHAMKILTEALERYPVDGLFFNMFGNPSADYSGQPMGPCHCDACKTRFQTRHGRTIPASADDDYRQFLAQSAQEVAAQIADLIHRKRPNAAFLTYIQQHTDGIMSESNTAVNRPLPLWPYSASDHVNRARNSEPDKMAFNLCMSFIDFPWRFATVPPAEIQLRLYQNMAHGAGPAFTVLGTLDQDDESAMLAARPVFQWHADHEELYVGQQSAARVLLLPGRQTAYRGFFRLLTEQHVPFAVSDNLKWLENAARQFDLVIAPDGAPAALEPYVRKGGRVLASGLNPPAFGIARPTGAAVRTRGYWRVHDHAFLPSLKNTRLLFFDGEYIPFAPLAVPLLTLIPEATFGPPEKVWTDKQETAQPGLLIASHGDGQIAYVPWDIGSLYYRHSSHAHAALLGDLIDHLLPRGRQIRTTAHPLIELTIMNQPKRRRTLVHLVNASGHSGTAYFAPLEQRDVEVQVHGAFQRARAMALGRSLSVRREGDRSVFVIPKVAAYEVVVLE